ncbi:MAG: ATP synthase subunit I [Oceanospirillaceae bacterium]|nr:ATP synthase subunit I [Oceanospirillaceae bacterium]
MLKNSRSTRGHTQVVRQKTLLNIVYQLIAIGAIALLVSLKSWEWGYSALLGGLIYLIPYAYAANRILIDAAHTTAEQSANRTLADLYIGQIWKMVIGALLFALVFVLVKPLSPFSLFGTYIAVQALGWYLQMRADKRFIKL